MSVGPPKIFVATLTTNGIMLWDCVASTIRMVTRLHAQGIATEYHTADGPNLIQQRDRLPHAFPESACTHLLFVDSDMAIERGCFLAQADDTPTHPSPMGGVRVRAFFREAAGPDGATLDPDYAFCKSWVARGGEVWADAGAQIRHVGDFRYGVPFSGSLNVLQASAPTSADAADAIPSASSTPREPASHGRNGARP